MTNTRNSEDDTTVGKTRVVTDACNNKNKKVWQVVAFIYKNMTTMIDCISLTKVIMLVTQSVSQWEIIFQSVSKHLI